MDMRSPQDTLTIDPIAMNVVNRVAAGCRLSGDLQFDGGLLVQGAVGVLEGEHTLPEAGGQRCTLHTPLAQPSGPASRRAR